MMQFNLLLSDFEDEDFVISAVRDTTISVLSCCEGRRRTDGQIMPSRDNYRYMPKVELLLSKDHLILEDPRGLFHPY